MKIGLVIYGSLETPSGGYLYDRMLVEVLRAHGDTVEIISLPFRNYAAHLTDNIHFRLPRGLDLLIQDELNHPSLLSANAQRHDYPVLCLVHHLRCSEVRPGWQNAFYRMVEKQYLQSIDGFIFNSQTTRKVVAGLIGISKPDIVAYPPTDRFGDGLSESEVRVRANERGPLRILFLGNVIERKGLHTLLEAIKTQPAAYKLDVVGSLTVEPEYVRKMRKQVELSDLSTVVTFHGVLGPEQLRQMLKQAQVLGVPSTYEGFGIVYLEGMGFGLPAIGTSLGAAGEIITEGVDGFIIKGGAVDSLAGILRRLNDQREVLVRMSIAARERYRRQPRWIETAGQIREFLRSFLG
jgi:glycosyltransferase involved in cell wall biosynthesis